MWWSEGHDAHKHPVTFRFRTLAERIVVDVEGLADVQGYIDEFVDVTSESVNETLTPGGQFSVAGHKLKVTGDKPEVSVYFVPKADPAGRVKVGGHLAENAVNRLIGMIPALSAKLDPQFSLIHDIIFRKATNSGRGI